MMTYPQSNGHVMLASLARLVRLARLMLGLHWKPIALQAGAAGHWPWGEDDR